MKKSSFNKMLFTIAFPITIQFFVTSSLNLMDNFMIGKLGEKAVAALGIANQYYFIFNILILGIYGGCNVLISQYWGKKDILNIKKIIGISLVIGIGVSILFVLTAEFFSGRIISIFNSDDTVIQMGKSYLRIVCISYIFMAISQAFGIASRGIHKTFLPMICSAIALILNIFFNYSLIFGHFNMPNMGIKGAAVATLIARIVEMILIVATIYGKNHTLKASFKEMFNFNNEFFINAMKTAIPILINDLCWGAGSIIYSIIYGHMGVKPLAAVNISMSVQNMFLIVLMGISNAACVIVGNEVGKDEFETAKIYSRKLLKICIALSLIMLLALVISSKSILTIYKISDEVYNNTFYMLLITAFILPVRFINVLLIVGILRGGGDASYALKVELATMWLIGVPICFIGAFFLKIPVYQIYALVTLEELVKCIIAIKRYKSDKWMTNIIGSMKVENLQECCMPHSTLE